MWRGHQIVNLLLAVVLGAVLLGGTPVRGNEGLEVDIAQLDDSAFPRVEAIVSVLEEPTRPLTGLDVEHFQAFSNDRPLAIEAVRPVVSSDIGIGIVLAIDVSGSMEGEPLAKAKAASQALLSQLAPQDEVAVVVFSDSAVVRQEFTADREEAIAVIESLTVGVNTALYDAAALSAGTAASSQLPRKLVVLLTDGQDYGDRSSLSRADSIAEAQSFGVPVYTIGLLGDPIDREYLEELAVATHAQMLLAPSPDELGALYQTVGELLRSQYALTIDASNAPREPAVTLRLEVTVDGRTASAERALPAAAAAPVPPTPTPMPTPADALAPLPAGAASQPEGPQPAGPSTPPQASGGGPWLLVALLALLLALGGGGLGLLRLRRRRRRRRPPEPVQEEASAPSEPAPEPAPSPPAPPVPERGKVLARLVLRDGVSENRVFDLGREPVTIGSDRGCNLVLQDPQGQVQPEQARIWLREEDSFMLHHLPFRGRTLVAGRPVSWTVLEDGDEIEIGPFRLLFELTSPAS